MDGEEEGRLTLLTETGEQKNLQEVLNDVRWDTRKEKQVQSLLGRAGALDFPPLPLGPRVPSLALCCDRNHHSIPQRPM